MGDNDGNLDTNMTPASRNAINVLSTVVYSSLVARVDQREERVQSLTICLPDSTASLGWRGSMTLNVIAIQYGDLDKYITTLLRLDSNSLMSTFILCLLCNRCDSIIPTIGKYRVLVCRLLLGPSQGIVKYSPAKYSHWMTFFAMN